jgi:hypothetical protein
VECDLELLEDRSADPSDTGFQVGVCNAEAGAEQEIRKCDTGHNSGIHQWPLNITAGIKGLKVNH